MAYLKIECSVARNRKFVQAGPAPSWLWVCGLAYCQEGLTDGFIPHEALPYLGVKNAAQLATHLVKAGLWHEDTGGWRVNDYLIHNKSASQVAELRAKRGAGGKHGGRPPKNLHETLKVSSEETFAVDVDASASVAVSVVEGGVGETSPPFFADVALRRLQAAYPQNRVTYGMRTENAYIDALNGEQSAKAAFDTMLANLETHKVSHEWRIKGMVPSLEKWLRDGLWKRRMDESAPVAEQLTSKTAKTLQAAADAIRRPA